MNFTQLHDRLRLELLRRIQRGTLSVSLLSRQTGLGQPHLSNFLRGHRRLSLSALDRVLTAQRISAADLLPALAYGATAPVVGEHDIVPLVSHAAALFEPTIRPSAIQSMLHFPATALSSLRAQPSRARRAWQRFVAVRIPAEDAHAMEPLVLPEAIALIDRHCNRIPLHRSGRPGLYVVRHGRYLRLRYVTLESNCLVLQPLNIEARVELIDLDQQNALDDLLAGRVALLLNEL